MNRIKFITFLYVSLFTVGLFSENNHVVDMKGGNEEFCNQNFKYDSFSQRISLYKKTIAKNFVVSCFCNPDCCKCTLAEHFIHNAEKALRKDIDNINDEEKSQDTKACTIRKFLLDMLQCDNSKRPCYVDLSRGFITFPFTGMYKDIVQQSLCELSNRSDDMNIKIFFSIIYTYFYDKTLTSFLFSGDIDYDLCIKECSDVPRFNGKNVGLQDDDQLLQVTLHTDKDVMLIGNEFVNFVRFKLKSNKDFDYTRCSGVSVENVCEYFLEVVKFCKDDVFVGMSKTYLYIPIPDDKYDEAKSIVDGINNMRQTWISRAFNSIFSWFGW